MSNLSDQIKSIEIAEQKLQLKKMRTIEKALKSDHPDDMLKGNQALNAIQKKTVVEPKSFLLDPLEFQSSLGYKDKPFSLSYTTLKRMSKAPIINSIIKTRKNQVADFAEPQRDRYDTGFLIRKKTVAYGEKMDNRDKKISNSITDFVLNCGAIGAWDVDDFDTFIRKIVEDSLTYDQMTFEVIRNRRGGIERFIATDAASYRIAESYFEQEAQQNDFFRRHNVYRDAKSAELINGYRPAYVQVYQNMKVNEFYPWELCFGTRNPSTSIYSNAYGTSELEELISIITSMLWGDEYNRRFFSQGSAPKGLLRVKGSVNEGALQQFKQQWQAMITGVMQSWKTPVVEGDIDWIDLQKNNRDMEYTSWMEYLIKLACAVYSIDPTEIGWDISRSSGNTGMFEGSQAARLQNSKDKGLYPLLKFLQRKLNKYVIEQINPEYELVFTGLNGMTIKDELDLDVKKVGSFMTFNEAREKWDMKPLGEAGDLIGNSIYYQSVNADKQREIQQAQQQQLQAQQDQPAEEQNPFDLVFNNEDEEEQNPFEAYETEKSEKNLFVKAFDNFLKEEGIE